MNDLHNLIKSLNANEKRYVSIYINRFSASKNNYSKLYQFIEKQEFYEENELIKKLRKEPFVKHLAVTKHYLFELILEAMREYYDEQFIDWKLRKQTTQIFVLTSKGLDKAAHKLIIKTKQECLQYENYVLLLDILNHERWLFGNRRIASNNVEFGKNICEEELQVISILQQLAEYKKIWHSLNFYELTRHNYTKKEYKQTIENAININSILPPTTTTSFLLNAQYHNTLAHYFLLTDDIYNQFLQNKKVVEIREKQLLAQPNSPIDLFATYYNFMLACYHNKEWSSLKSYLQKMQELETKSIEKKIKFFHDYYYCALLYNLGTENYKDGYCLTSEIKNGLELYQNKIRDDFYIWLCQCSGLVCFFNKKYTEAYKWWQNILLNDKIKIEINKQCAIELYTLILVIEEQKTDVLDYQIKQTEKKLNDNNLIGLAEKEFFDFLKNSLKNKTNIKLKYQKTYQLLCKYQLENKAVVVDEFILKWFENRSK